MTRLAYTRAPTSKRAWTHLAVTLRVSSDKQTEAHEVSKTMHGACVLAAMQTFSSTKVPRSQQVTKNVLSNFVPWPSLALIFGCLQYLCFCTLQESITGAEEGLGMRLALSTFKCKLRNTSSAVPPFMPPMFFCFCFSQLQLCRLELEGTFTPNFKLKLGS